MLQHKNYRHDPKFSDGYLEQTVQTQIRLLLDQQPDQGLHCLQFILYFCEAFLVGTLFLCSNFSDYVSSCILYSILLVELFFF